MSRGRDRLSLGCPCPVQPFAFRAGTVPAEDDRSLAAVWLQERADHGDQHAEIDEKPVAESHVPPKVRYRRAAQFARKLPPVMPIVSSAPPRRTEHVHGAPDPLYRALSFRFAFLPLSACARRLNGPSLCTRSRTMLRCDRGEENRTHKPSLRRIALSSTASRSGVRGVRSPIDGVRRASPAELPSPSSHSVALSR